MGKYFSYYHVYEKYHLKYAKGTPSLNGREFHNYHEIVWFLGGNARLISKNIQNDLTEGCLVIVPRASFHQFNVSGDDYTRLILGFRETEDISDLVSAVMNEVKIIEKPDGSLQECLDRLRKMVVSDFSEEEKKLFIRASLIQILIYLKKCSIGAISKSTFLSETVQSALSYIDGHFTEEMSVELIAEALHVSPSHLFHKFKKELNISVYQYIAKKRMSNARLLIESGNSLHFAAVHSGFGDYSAFYRMYKKNYGESPSCFQIRALNSEKHE